MRIVKVKIYIETKKPDKIFDEDFVFLDPKCLLNWPISKHHPRYNMKKVRD